MDKVTVIAKSKADASKVCRERHGWTPDAVRAVDSGNSKERAWMCFESARDAETWDKQK